MIFIICQYLCGVIFACHIHPRKANNLNILNEVISI